MTGSTRPYSILITDDDPSCRDALRDIVEQAGYRTLIASSGEEAVEIANSEAVHVALMDMHMPRLTGVETAQLIKQLHAALPWILITADATAEVMRQAFAAQAFSVIPKPVSKNVVLYTVVRAIVRVYGPPPEPQSPSVPGDGNREGRTAE